MRIVSLLAVFFACFVGAGTATAAAPAPAGSSFAASYLDLPAGAIPAGQSGKYYDMFSASPASQDGRYVAFISDANRLSADAHPDTTNVYRKDRQTGDVVLISRQTGPAGTSPALPAYQPQMSDDGNLIIFLTEAKLSASDPDSELDVYVRDIASNTTTLATPGTAASIGDADLSGNGVWITFTANEPFLGNDMNAFADVYRRNLTNGTTELVSTNTIGNGGNNNSFDASISNDGRWIAFQSAATNLVAGFVNGSGSTDIFVRDMNSANKFVVSAKYNQGLTGSNGSNYQPEIAGTPSAITDVRVAYTSEATDVLDNAVTDSSSATSVYLRKFGALPSTLISRATGGANADSRASGPKISDDGNLVIFSSDANNLGAGVDYYGTYLRNDGASTTTLASARNHYSVSGDISGSGNLLTWPEQGGATPDSDPDAYGIFARPAPSGAIELVSRPSGNAPFLLPGFDTERSYSGQRTISADGRYVVFSVYSPKLNGAENGQIFRRDLVTGKLDLVSRRTGADGAISTGVDYASMSADGSRVAFTSYNTLSDDVPGTFNTVWVRDFNTNTTTLVSRGDGVGGVIPDKDSGAPSISGDGKRVAFESKATNLGDPAGKSQIYIRDLSTNQTLIASRATTEAGAPGNGESSDARLNGDGSRVVFESTATNLHPDNVAINRDIYLRELSSNTTSIVSRLPGPAGVPSTDYSYHPTISADGKVIAFDSDDELLAPEAGPWPVGKRQIVSRVVETGTNTLVSRAPGGAPGEQNSGNASISGDGSFIAFDSSSPNLIPGIGGIDRDGIFIRNMASGALAGPPAFGLVDYPANQMGSHAPTISDNGQCVLYNASGYNAISGDLGDIDSSYVYVNTGTCSDPRLASPPTPVVKPVLTKVKLTPKRFAVGKKPTAKVSAKKKKKAKKGTKIGYTLNADASVTIRIEKKVAGRKQGGKCRKVTKKNKAKKKCSRFVLAGKLSRKSTAGAKKVAFSGRIGKKKLKPGKYRAVLSAKNTAGTSKSVRRPFTIVRR